MVRRDLIGLFQASGTSPSRILGPQANAGKIQIGDEGPVAGSVRVVGHTETEPKGFPFDTSSRPSLVEAILALGL